MKETGESEDEQARQPRSWHKGRRARTAKRYDFARCAGKMFLRRPADLRGTNLAK